LHEIFVWQKALSMECVRLVTGESRRSGSELVRPTAIHAAIALAVAGGCQAGSERADHTGSVTPRPADPATSHPRDLRAELADRLSWTAPDAPVVVGVVEEIADPALAPLLATLEVRAAAAACSVDARPPHWIAVCDRIGDLGDLGVPPPSRLVARVWIGGMVAAEAELRYAAEADAARAEQQIRRGIAGFLARPGAALLGTVGASRDRATVHLRATLTRVAAAGLASTLGGMGAGKPSGGGAAVR
jgi:hypothetical protein